MACVSEMVPTAGEGEGWDACGNGIPEETFVIRNRASVALTDECTTFCLHKTEHLEHPILKLI